MSTLMLGHPQKLHRNNLVSQIVVILYNNTMHIYVITNRINGKIYVGQHNGNNLERYLADKIRKAKKEPRKTMLYSAICKYGPTAFRITSLCQPVSIEQMDEMEQHYIRVLDAQNRDIGYNVFPGGHVGARGIKFSEDHKRKIGLKSKGRKISEETRQKQRDAALNRSPETRAKMSAAQKGKKLKPEHLAAMRAGFENMSRESRQRMETGYLKVDFSNRSEEHCRNISEALKGRTLSEETKRKLSAIRKGKPQPKHQTDAIRKSFMVRTTPEQRSAMAKLANEVRWGKKSLTT